jgi:hypothetical protein
MICPSNTTVIVCSSLYVLPYSHMGIIGCINPFPFKHVIINNTHLSFNAVSRICGGFCMCYHAYASTPHFVWTL